MTKAAKAVALADPTNGAAETIGMSQPYTIAVTIEGTSHLLFHRWNNDAIAAKGAASKNSKAKKSDDVESYVYRDEKGEVCLPGEYLRQAVITAAKFRQDPRSPRKSAMDLFKAGLVCTTELASLGTKQWHYEHRARVQVQRAGITRTRPAFREWAARFDLMVLVPEYIDPALLREVITDAGRLVGVGDFRPTYGRFAVSRWAKK